MPPLLIDDRGKVWESHSLVLRSRLRASIDDRELHEFAILNLGFIGLASSRGEHSHSVAPGACQAGGAWRVVPVAASMCSRAACCDVVQRPLAGRNHRMASRRMATYDLLAGEAGTSDAGLLARDYSARPASKRNPLRHVLEDTSRLASIFVDPAQMLPEQLCDRYLLFMEDENRELRVCDFGAR